MQVIKILLKYHNCTWQENWHDGSCFMLYVIQKFQDTQFIAYYLEYEVFFVFQFSSGY